MDIVGQEPGVEGGQLGTAGDGGRSAPGATGGSGVSGAAVGAESMEIGVPRAVEMGLKMT